MKLLKKKKINLIQIIIFYYFVPTLSNFFVNDIMCGYCAT